MGPMVLIGDATLKVYPLDGIGLLYSIAKIHHQLNYKSDKSPP